MSELELVGWPCATSSRMMGYTASYRPGSLLCAAASRVMLPLMSLLTRAKPVPSLSALHSGQLSPSSASALASGSASACYICMSSRAYRWPRAGSPITGSSAWHALSRAAVLMPPAWVWAARRISAMVAKTDIV